MSSAAGQSAGRGRTLLLNLLLAVFSLLLTAALAEVLARAWVEVELARARADAPEVPLSRFHPVLGWEKTPLATQRIRRPEFDISFSVNSRGLRGPERDYAKPAGTRRVLILGDSFAAGYYVEEGQTLRAVLEGMLNTGGCGPAEAINGGTIAYSTDQEYLFYTTEGRRYAPDAVLLAFYYNDLFYNASRTGPGGEAKPYFELHDDALVPPAAPLRARDSGEAGHLADPAANRPKPWRGSMALRLLSRRTVDAAPRLHAFLAGLGLVQPPALDPPREYWVFGLDHRREVADMWARTRLLLKALRDSVQADGARLVLLYVPIRFEVNEEAWELTRQRYRWGRRWDRARVFERLTAIARELAIPVVDPRDELRRAELGGWPTYYTRDVHWTRHGNAVAAHAAEREVRRALECAAP